MNFKGVSTDSPCFLDIWLYTLESIIILSFSIGKKVFPPPAPPLPTPQLYEILPWLKVLGKCFKQYYWWRMFLSYSYLQIGFLYQIRELSSLLALLSCVRLVFFPTEKGCFHGHFSGKGREASLWRLLPLCLCRLQRKHTGVLIPREIVLVDRRERTPDSCFFVSLWKHKQPSGGLLWGSSDWDSELPIQGAQVPSLMTGSTYCK